MDAKDVLESVDRELDFYRTRQASVYYLAMVAQVLVASGRFIIPVRQPQLAAIAYTLFFATIAVFSVLFYRSYAERDAYLTNKRAELIQREGLMDPFKKPERYKTPSPSYLNLIVVVMLSLITILITWIGDYTVAAAGPAN